MINLANPRPDWAARLTTSSVKVWQAVALSLDVEPTTIRHAGLESAKRVDAWSRLGGFQASIYLLLTKGALLLDYGTARDFNQRVAVAMCEFALRGVLSPWGAGGSGSMRTRPRNRVVRLTLQT